MPEPPGSRVDEHGDLTRMPRPEDGCRGRVEDLIDALHFEEVIARAESAKLLEPACTGLLAHRIRRGTGDRALRLDARKILRPAEPPRDRPGSPMREHLVQIRLGQPKPPAGANARGHVLEKTVRKRPEVRRDLLVGERRGEQPDPAVDVVSYAARRDHAIVEPHGGHAANRKAVA